MRQTHKRAMVNENNLIVCHRVARLVDACASAAGIDPLDIYRETRARHVTRVRHRVMYLAYRCKAGTMRQIGRALGRDHSLVVQAVAAVEKIRQADEGMDAAISVIETELRERWGDLPKSAARQPGVS